MLKALMLNKKKRDLQVLLNEVRNKITNLAIREKEIESAIEEAATEEEIQVVTEEVEQHEANKKSLEDEEKDLESKINDIDVELEKLDKDETEPKKSKRKEEIEIMDQRKVFGGMTREKAIAFIEERADVKEFLDRTREFKGQKRAVTGADLLIPEVLIGILRDEIHNYSKLISKVWLRPIKGTARIILPGAIPEAVWTEACAKLNELDINFNEMEVDGYKVGGYIPICNATLEDASDIDLYNEIMYMLAQAIGFAIDKAVIYGTGSKMPLGIVTRLAQTVAPADYNPNARPWTNLSTTNIAQVAGTTGEEVFADLVLKSGAIKKGNGVKTWAMNETTYTILQSKMVSFNASGAVVASLENTMPIIGGNIVILNFIPDGDIIGGYFGNYLLVERSGMNLAASEHVQFIEDNTVFKGTARYDGAPAIAESFAALNITSKAPTTTMTFAPDEANTETPGA